MNDWTARLVRLIEKAGESANVSLTARQINQLVAYWSVLNRWNAKVNLTSVPLEPPTAKSVRRLIWEPLLASQLNFGEPGLWFDLGSGSGSPAIPMKVARPSLPLCMVESRSRKVAFLREVIRETELQVVEVINSRIEALPGSAASGSVGLVTMRAVRLTPRIVGTICELVGQSGKVILFGCPDRTPFRDSFSEESFDSKISLLTRLSESNV